MRKVTRIGDLKTRQHVFDRFSLENREEWKCSKDISKYSLKPVTSASSSVLNFDTVGFLHCGG